MSSDAFDRTMAERWHLYQPPARPSRGDVATYRALMAEPCKTLLLGSTPEVRSLAHELGHEFAAVDRSEDVFRALELLVDVKGAVRFQCCDWLHMDLDERFDLVLCDGGINMLEPSEHELFVERVAAHVNPGGRFVLHAHVWGEPSFSSEEAVFSWFRTTRPACGIYSATRAHLSLLWCDRETGGLSNRDCFDRLRALFARGRITEEEFAPLDAIFRGDDLVVYCVRAERLLSLVAPCFDLERTLRVDDYERADLKPFYVLRRKPL